MIGWQSTTYQAAEGTATVQACAQVLNGAANLGSGTITLQVSTSANTAQGRPIYKCCILAAIMHESVVTLNVPISSLEYHTILCSLC